MDQLSALRETVSRVRLMPKSDVVLPTELSLEHLEEMLIKAEKGHFSDAKLGRWLGWAQAAATILGAITLDEAKGINAHFSNSDYTAAEKGVPSPVVASVVGVELRTIKPQKYLYSTSRADRVYFCYPVSEATITFRWASDVTPDEIRDFIARNEAAL